MSNFKSILDATLNEMMPTDQSLTFCCAVYMDAICEDNAIVMFMEYDNYANMHEVMSDLHKRLSKKLGYPVSVCHNHPTDEQVLIHGSSIDAKVYYADECCKRSMLQAYENWKAADRKGYREEVRSIFFGVELISECSTEPKETPEDILESLNWNEDPQSQVISLLSSYLE